MNLLFNTLHKFHCHSTHQKLVLDAVHHLSGDSMPRWRNLLLKHHEPLLRGAIDPDTKFQDFENHVLSRAASSDGGAQQAARHWYGLLVEALHEQNWREAAYRTGVLSHYYTDPLQPLHAEYTPAAVTLHQLLERSVRHGYDRLRAAAERARIPAVRVPHGERWLERMVEEGAEEARTQQETLLAQFNVRIAKKNPARALNGPCRDILSRLLGHATAGTAKIVERALTEAAVDPPKVLLLSEAAKANLAVPAQVAARRLAEDREAEAIRATFRELQRRGRVDENLSPEVLALREHFEVAPASTNPRAA